MPAWLTAISLWEPQLQIHEDPQKLTLPWSTTRCLLGHLLVMHPWAGAGQLLLWGGGGLCQVLAEAKWPGGQGLFAAPKALHSNINHPIWQETQLSHRTLGRGHSAASLQLALSCWWSLTPSVILPYCPQSCMFSSMLNPLAGPNPNLTAAVRHIALAQLGSGWAHLQISGEQKVSSISSNLCLSISAFGSNSTFCKK